MFHRTRSFLSCVSLSTVLALGACSGGGSESGQRVRFSEASSEDIVVVIMMVGLAEFATIVAPIVAFFEGQGSDCPQITITSIIGNGCVTPGGTRYDGSAVMMPNATDLFASMTYREFRRTDAEGGSFYLDGTVVYSQESDEELRYELSMVVEVQDGFDAEAGQAEVEISATCQIPGEGNVNCTLEAGATANVDDLEFTIEGTHTMGDGGGLLGSQAEVTARGEDSVQIEYDVATECMRYTVEGGEPQEYCVGD